MSDLKVNEIKTDTIKNQAGTSAATIDSSGRILTPARPAFRARKTSSQSTSSGNELITWNTAPLNIGSHFGSNVFTAPVAGIYSFSIVLLTNNDSANHTFSFRHTPSGGSLTTILTLYSPVLANHETVSGSFIHQMGVGDTMGVYLDGANDIIYGDAGTWTHWSGFLIG
tara:strand:- start:147 stop:653 length:507 start_codon:yes stop_codon:yes gene_type:complete